MKKTITLAAFAALAVSANAATILLINGNFDAAVGWTLADGAGANSFDFTRIETDIAAVKKISEYVIVNVQYWECYAYPNGYIEYPVCDKPIGEQEANFKKIVDLGADMVVGTSAHQPQTYELYNGKPIYYGLGNLYFDQTSWPGTERGIILTHYFINGELTHVLPETPAMAISEMEKSISAFLGPPEGLPNCFFEKA